MKQQPKREFFKCDCHTEGVILDSDHDVPGHPQIYLAFWSYGQGGGRIGFLERLRWCFHILKTGLPWTDAVVMEWSEAEKLAKAILRRVYGRSR